MDVVQSLNDLQVKALGSNPCREAVVAYCNACINNGLGALKGYYDSEDKGNVAAYGALTLWLNMTRKKLGLEE